ncbi:MAG: hypothetical protein GQ542_14240 [Desulforhopalus sp.]|nr:hypothetical protein [Desulforhopalus sp.]
MIELLTLTSTEEFERVTQQKLSLVAFGTPWSTPCQNQSEILVNFLRRCCDIMVIARLDVEKYPGIARKCHIQTVPTLVVYRDTSEIKRLVGLQSIENLHTLEQAMRFSDINQNATGEADARLQFLLNKQG